MVLLQAGAVGGAGGQPRDCPVGSEMSAGGRRGADRAGAHFGGRERLDSLGSRQS